MHHLPFGIMNKTYGEEIRKRDGEVIEVDVDQDGLGRGPYLHTKIWVDISKPLICGSLINIEGKITWIPLKYECLPNFFFLL